jgi:hypothetical protein
MNLGSRPTRFQQQYRFYVGALAPSAGRGVRLYRVEQRQRASSSASMRRRAFRLCRASAIAGVFPIDLS